MRKKFYIVLAINAVLLIFVAFFAWHLSLKENPSGVQLPIPPDIQIKTASASSTPSRLLIPHIEVDTHVQLVGLTQTKNMAVPNNFTDVGWYRLGFAPGVYGNAVIAGHLDNGKGKSAVFENLHKLQIGDSVYVINNAGEKLEFQVTGSERYDYDNAPVQEIFGPADEARLNLITCDGVWDNSKRIYDKRLVVYTKLVAVSSIESQ